jgi:hypothetical protein
MIFFIIINLEGGESYDQRTHKYFSQFPVQGP